MQVALLLALSTWTLGQVLRPLALAYLETAQNPRRILSPPLSWLGVAWRGSAHVQIPALSDALVLLILCAIVIAWWRFRPDRLAATGLGFFAGGAIGNTTEQFRFGSVTDYIPGPADYMLNLADLAVATGAVLLATALVLSFRTRQPRGPSREPSPSARPQGGRPGRGTTGVNPGGTAGEAEGPPAPRG